MGSRPAAHGDVYPLVRIRRYCVPDTPDVEDSESPVPSQTQMHPNAPAQIIERPDASDVAEMFYPDDGEGDLKRLRDKRFQEGKPVDNHARAAIARDVIGVREIVAGHRGGSRRT